ncbi:hypothetical protein MYX76_03425 [Desulfobacterota bacterium AH_259_B03_O07]|nr:hypothetical protein [Desulfobacterota bacterium AH_259_B03_O07]
MSSELGSESMCRTKVLLYNHKIKVGAPSWCEIYSQLEAAPTSQKVRDDTCGTSHCNDRGNPLAN